MLRMFTVIERNHEKICFCIWENKGSVQLRDYHMQQFLQAVKMIILDEKLIYFFIFAQNIDCEYMLEPPQ